MAEYLKMDTGPMKAHDFLKKVRLSVHGFIHPDGTYEHMIKSPGRAHHAGTSKWNGLQHLNSHYLGFELLVPGKHDYGSSLKAFQSNAGPGSILPLPLPRTSSPEQSEWRIILLTGILYILIQYLHTSTARLN